MAALVFGSGTLWLLTRPTHTLPEDLPAHEPDLVAGEVLFHAGSCLACHAAGEGVSAPDGLPAGGAPFETPIGTFYPLNLTPDPETGLGRWSRADFVTAMAQGVAPDGRHYFPAFPYPSYRRMPTRDLLDLYGYLMSLPAVKSPARAPDLPMLGLARRGVGLWKRLALAQPIETLDTGQDPRRRGAYLANGPGHCGECHTPRDRLMIPIAEGYLAGGPHPRGEGEVPSLLGLVRRGRYKDAADLTFAMQYGEALGYDKLSSGGMGAIQANLARLPEGELRAIAEYLISLN